MSGASHQNGARKRAEISPELADAADVLSDQLRIHLLRFAQFLEPHLPRLERRFLAKLKKLGFDVKIRTALNALTAGAAAKVLAADAFPLKFIEQLEYNGRRLAKLNLPPSGVMDALQEYDRLLSPLLATLAPPEAANLQWVREQLQFCVILTLNNAYYQVREAETQAFYELFRAEFEASSFDELLSRYVKSLSHVCRADAGRLYLLSDDKTLWTLRAQAGRLVQTARGFVQNRPELSKGLSQARQIDTAGRHSNLLLDAEWRNSFQSCWSVPLASNGRIFGVLQLGFEKRYEWLPREQELLAAASERCLLAAERAKLIEDLAAREEQIRHLAEHMLHVEEIERRRISRELHDEAGQSLLCIRLQLELLEESLPAEQAESIAKLRQARDITEHTIIEIRRLIAALSPAVLEQLGLGAALRQLVNRFRQVHPVRVKLRLGGLSGVPQQIEVILYRLVQECFNNIGKHSEARAVNISVHSTDGKVELVVEDDGVGFHVGEAFSKRDSFGLAGMRERVALLGGQFEVISNPGGSSARKRNGDLKRRGTRIRIELPVAESGACKPERSLTFRRTRAAIVRQFGAVAL